MFSLRDVTCTLGEHTVLDALSLQFPPRQTTALIGPSGCGKSTLLRLLLGLQRPRSGSVTFDGTPVTPANAAELRRRAGYVIQRGGLFPHLTACANVTLMARHLGWAAERITARVETLRELTRFPADGLARYPSELSGGQNQRVSLMRALMLDPDVLLLDEPLGALDPMIRHDLQEDLRAVFDELGKTVVLVTHDLAEAAYLARHIVLMNAGGIETSGPLAALLNAPEGSFTHRFVRAQRDHLAAADG